MTGQVRDLTPTEIGVLLMGRTGISFTKKTDFVLFWIPACAGMNRRRGQE